MKPLYLYRRHPPNLQPAPHFTTHLHMSTNPHSPPKSNAQSTPQYNTHLPQSLQSTMATSSSSSSSPNPDAPLNATPIPDDPHPTPDLPLTMSASVILTSLPRDAHTALENTGGLERVPQKGNSPKSSPFIIYASRCASQPPSRRTYLLVKTSRSTRQLQ